MVELDPWEIGSMGRGTGPQPLIGMDSIQAPSEVGQRKKTLQTSRWFISTRTCSFAQLFHIGIPEKNGGTTSDHLKPMAHVGLPQDREVRTSGKPKSGILVIVGKDMMTFRQIEASYGMK